MKSLSRVWLFATPWTVTYQAPRSMGFSRQEYWSGLPFPSPGDLPNPGIEPGSPALKVDALTSEPPGKPNTKGALVLEKTLESPLDSKEIKPINPKGNQPWIFIGRIDADTEAPVLATWCKEVTHWKRPWCWKDRRQKEKAKTEDEMVGWHHWLNGPEFD